MDPPIFIFLSAKKEKRCRLAIRSSLPQIYSKGNYIAISLKMQVLYEQNVTKFLLFLKKGRGLAAPTGLVHILYQNIHIFALFIP